MWAGSLGAFLGWFGWRDLLVSLPSVLPLSCSKLEASLLLASLSICLGFGGLPPAPSLSLSLSSIRVSLLWSWDLLWQGCLFAPQPPLPTPLLSPPPAWVSLIWMGGDWNSPGGAGLGCHLPGFRSGDHRCGVRTPAAGIAKLLGGDWPCQKLKTTEEQGPAAARYGEATAVLGMLEVL